MRRQRDKQKRIQFDQIDIREVLDDLNIYYTESGKNVSDGWIGVSCPFCDDDSNHLGINLGGKSVSCFKCGTTGTIIKYLSEEIGSYSKAMSILGDSVPREMKIFSEKEQERAISVSLPAEATRKINKYHAQYLNSRKYSWKYLTKKYDLHFTGPVGDWKNRIIVPIKNRGKLVTFTSVSIEEDSNLRYRHLPDEKSIISIKHSLYGLEHARRNPICCLVEGLFDKYRIGDGCLCSFGTNITAEQKHLLTRFTKVLICFDGDLAGRVAAEKIANDISVFIDVEILYIPEGSDPDKLEKDDIRFIRNKMGRD